MIIQTQNSTYIVEWMQGGITERWGIYRYSRAPATQIRNYTRNLTEAHFEGDTLILGKGKNMVLVKGGKKIIETSTVLKIEP